MVSFAKNIIWFGFCAMFLANALLANTAKADDSSIYLAPSSGSFLTGSTFSVSILLNTKNEEINAIQLDLKFPPEILQVVSSTSGKSFISEWITLPSYSNSEGTVSFRGGVPEGIITSAGLISELTFRAKSSGTAKVEIMDSSMVLLKDGKGTEVRTKNFSGSYEILVSPPEGPKIASDTHPDSGIWYADFNPHFVWQREEGDTDYSYSFSQNPLETPDTVSKGPETSKSFSASDGIWYFHLRSKKNGEWGKTSHFSVKIDGAPPQEFESRVDLATGFLFFDAKDYQSGIDHYEISVLNSGKNPDSSPFFVEGASPFKISSRETGKYHATIRAFDKAGNFREEAIEFQIISPLFSFGDKGGVLAGVFLPWWALILVALIIIAAVLWLIFYLLNARRMKFKKGIKEIEEALQEIEKIEKGEKEIQNLKIEYEEEKKKLEEKLR